MKSKKVLAVGGVIVAVVLVVVGFQILFLSDSGTDENLAVSDEVIASEIQNAYAIHPETQEVVTLKNGEARYVADDVLIIFELSVGDLITAFDGSKYSASKLIITDEVNGSRKFLALYRYVDGQVEHLASLQLEESFGGEMRIEQGRYGIVVSLSSEVPFDTPYVEKQYTTGILYEQYYSYRDGVLYLDNKYKN